MADVASRIYGRVQITTDGWISYPDVIRKHLLGRLDYAVIHKIYSREEDLTDSDRRYSPPKCVAKHVKVRAGCPRRDRIDTCFVERANLTVRTFNRRFTRLCPGWSRKLENHRHSVALFAAAYNFCKIHSTLGTTPAHGHKITDHPWTIEELIQSATIC
jgi:hypothetical protein